MVAIKKIGKSLYGFFILADTDPYSDHIGRDIEIDLRNVSFIHIRNNHGLGEICLQGNISTFRNVSSDQSATCLQTGFSGQMHRADLSIAPSYDQTVAVSAFMRILFSWDVIG